MKFPSPVRERRNCHIRISSLVTWFVNFDAKSLCLLGMYCEKMTLSLKKKKKVTSSGPDVQKGYKILQMSCLEFQTHFSSCITYHNFRPSCQAVSVPFHSGNLESCVELVGR
jgi:hypothetical protein